MATSCSSSSSMLTLCSSLTSQCKISNHKLPFSFSKPLFNTKPEPSFGSLSKSHISPRPPFLPIPKFSEVEEPALEAEPDTPESDSEPGTLQIVEAAKEVPKREEIFAVVMVGGRQYIVIPGRFLYIQRLKGAKANDKITLNKVLLIGTRTRTYIGEPVVTNAAVHAVVEEQGLNPKVIVFKYKKKKNYRRNIGHRQPNSRIRITGITGYEDYPYVTLDS
uniref:50S ribosomal protein L21 n=1 Tax=Rhizophora mucronata TaxID=61149 RepID=A0A2P2JG66_RHIMU